LSGGKPRKNLTEKPQYSPRKRRVATIYTNQASPGREGDSAPDGEQA
jgi:hypothetical protein